MKIRKLAFGTTLAMTLTASIGVTAFAKEIAICVPSADHGWTGAVLSLAQEKAD